MQIRSAPLAPFLLLCLLGWLGGCSQQNSTLQHDPPKPTRTPYVGTPQLEQVGATVIATAPPLATIDSHFTIRAYDEQRDRYVESVISKISNWEGNKTPGHSRWQVNFPDGEPALISMGWCAVDRRTLDENWKKMEYELKIDGENIPLARLKKMDWSESDRICYGYSGILTDWDVGRHSYIWTHRIFETLNDGWDIYPAGDYIMDFAVTIMR